MILYAMGLVLVYVGVSTTYSVTVGFLVIFGLPLLLTMHVIRPASNYAAGHLRSKSRGSEKAAVR